ncbi:MAG TPA: TIGR00730 family Rossman fold protein [Methylibium sp.]|nr:TIGR00730 family Rossman fold protein [Methylibium sp.]
MKPLSLCVYCGSRAGRQPDYAEAARAVGRAIGERGWRLVYGGGAVGLMGIVADAALAAGATVVGVIPRSLQAREVGHRGLTELHVVDTMHQRKQAMAERADAFLALPGGVGTLEELFEVWTWRQLGYHDRPIGLLNVAGYYDRLIALMDDTVAEDFVSPGTRALLEVGIDPTELLDRLADRARSATGPDDFRLT